MASKVQRLVLLACAISSALSQEFSNKKYDEEHTVTYNNTAGAGRLVEPVTQAKEKDISEDNILDLKEIQRLPTGCKINQLSLLSIAECHRNDKTEYWVTELHTNDTGR